MTLICQAKGLWRNSAVRKCVQNGVGVQSRSAPGPLRKSAQIQGWGPKGVWYTYSHAKWIGGDNPWLRRCGTCIPKSAVRKCVQNGVGVQSRSAPGPLRKSAQIQGWDPKGVWYTYSHAKWIGGDNPWLRRCGTCIPKSAVRKCVQNGVGVQSRSAPGPLRKSAQIQGWDPKGVWYTYSHAKWIGGDNPWLRRCGTCIPKSAVRKCVQNGVGVQSRSAPGPPTEIGPDSRVGS